MLSLLPLFNHMHFGPGLPGPAGFGFPAEDMKRHPVLLNSDLNEPRYLFRVALMRLPYAASALLIFISTWSGRSGTRCLLSFLDHMVWKTHLCPISTVKIARPHLRHVSFRRSSLMLKQ